MVSVRIMLVSLFLSVLINRFHCIVNFSLFISMHTRILRIQESL